MPLFDKADRPSKLREVSVLLDRLEAALPGMLARHAARDDEFWNAFLSEADVIEELATEPEDDDYVQMRLDAMLLKARKLPQKERPRE